jgi:very-short-patch-repair endonuclease
MKKLMKLASAQHAVFHRHQAVECGLSRDQIWNLHRQGVIERVVRNVYRLSGSPRTWRQRLMIAVLAAGPGAAVSGRAALALMGVPGYREGPVEVTQPRRPSRRYKVAAEHSTTYLPEHHIRMIDGIPVTCIERAVFDVSGRVSERRARQLVKFVVGRKLTTFANLATVLAETGAFGRRGTKMLRVVLAELTKEPLTESELEDLVLAVLRAAGIELPERQIEVGGTKAPVGRIDFLYRVARIVIEADSKRWHGDWVATEADHRRDALLTAAGYHVIRTNWGQLVDEPELFVNAVLGALARAAA